MTTMSYWEQLGLLTASDALVVEGHMLVTAELHLFDGGPSCDKGRLRDRQEDFS